MRRPSSDVSPMESSIESIFDEVKYDKKQNVDDKQLQEKCLKHFDYDGDGALNLAEFTALCSSLFSNSKNETYPIQEMHITEIFSIFDKNKNNKIDSYEFQFCWEKWITIIIWPVSCLLIVDVQNDFISGSLAIKHCPAEEDGAEVVPVINKMICSVPFKCYIYSLDWHPPNHVSFIDNLKERTLHPDCKVKADDAKLYDKVMFECSTKAEQILWPIHCVQNTWGAELHSDLIVTPDALFIHKGCHPDIDSYSAFWDNCKLSQTRLTDELRKQNVTDVYVCGLAYDVCVASTAHDSLEMGFRTILVEDATRGIVYDDIRRTKESLCDKHAVTISSDEVKAMVEGNDRRPEVAYHAALHLAG
ncbi:Uncharacterised protein g6664 [Pycnogonum litorale]